MTCLTTAHIQELENNSFYHSSFILNSVLALCLTVNPLCNISNCSQECEMTWGFTTGIKAFTPPHLAELSGANPRNFKMVLCICTGDTGGTVALYFVWPSENPHHKTPSTFIRGEHTVLWIVAHKY